jgi:hypothetical protein
MLAENTRHRLAIDHKRFINTSLQAGDHACRK